MGWFSSWLNQTGQIELLSRQVNFLTAQLEKEQWKNEQLEKGLIKERGAKDKILLRHADMMSEQAKHRGKFIADAAVKEAPAPEPLTAWQEEKLDMIARASMEADIDEGKEPEPFHIYQEAVHAKRDHYLSSVN